MVRKDDLMSVDVYNYQQRTQIPRQLSFSQNRQIPEPNPKKTQKISPRPSSYSSIDGVVNMWQRIRELSMTNFKSHLNLINKKRASENSEEHSHRVRSSMNRAEEKSLMTVSSTKKVVSTNHRTTSSSSNQQITNYSHQQS